MDECKLFGNKKIPTKIKESKPKIFKLLGD